jgi:hypothetical protein
MPFSLNSPRFRELVWLASLNHCGQVICNICGGAVKCGEPWDVSHVGVPKAWGGDSGGIAHRQCNHDHGAKVVTPMVAKAKRQRRKHLGIAGNGLSTRPMPCGRNSDFKRTMRGAIVRRFTKGGGE